MTAHTALIAAALYATTQARLTPTPVSTMVRPVYFPPRVQPVTSVRSGPTSSAPGLHHQIVFAPRVDVVVTAPSLDLSSVMSRVTDFPTNSSDHVATRSAAAPGDSPTGALRADEVEKQAALVPGIRPIYPDALRSAGVEGQVTVEFVVDESGRAEASSVRFLRSDNTLFEESVRSALRRMRFTPAEIGGRKVRQLVQMPFVFALQK
ncbi:MAG TPA: TonB family protein [Gemmatimonadaceae bacterium]